MGKNNRGSVGKKICVCVPKRFGSEIEIEVCPVPESKLHNCNLQNAGWSTGRHTPRKVIEQFLDYAIAMKWTSLGHLGWYFLTKDFSSGLKRMKKSQYEDYSLTYQSTVLRQADRANDMTEHLIADTHSQTIQNVMNLALILDGLEGMIKQYILREVMKEELESVQLAEDDFAYLSSQPESGWKYEKIWQVIQKLMKKYYVLLRHFTYIGIAPKIKINLDMATEDIKRDRILKQLEDTLEDSPDGKEWFEGTCVRICRNVLAKSNPAEEIIDIDRDESLTELEA